MKTHSRAIPVAAVVSILALTGQEMRAEEPSPPNVVLIFADDLGYGDLGCYGATKLKTPNIDRLARGGRMFTDAHSASAVCTPSRYALLTGEYPVRKNIYVPAMLRGGLLVDTNQQTIGSLMHDAGYATACIGKWHLGFGKERPDWNGELRPGPLELGFDYYFGVPVVNSHPPFVYVENHRVVGLVPEDPFVPNKKAKTREFPEKMGLAQIGGADAAHALYDDEMVGTKLVERAIEWIKARGKSPFFLYLATTNIHHPFTPHPRFKGTSQCGRYGDFVHELDWMVGEVMKTLEEQGVTDNTLVIFTSDNGGMFNVGGQNAWEAGHALNGELLGFKFSAWEGGHRVPFIARWPGRIEAGTTSSALICNIDMIATLAAITGSELKAGQGRDSVNILPALQGTEGRPLRDHLLLAARQPSHLAVRKGKWMYIGARGGGGFTQSKRGAHAFGGPAAITFTKRENSDIANGRIKPNAPPAQLYDLEADVNQTKNLYDEYPEVVKEMSALLAGYAPPKQRSVPKRGGGKASAASRAAERIAKTPSARSAAFDFESGMLEPWRVIKGQFSHIVGNRDAFFHNKGEYNKQGEYYLTTLETSAAAEKGSDPQTGVIVSPLFIPKGGKMTFRVGGGGGPRTYVALCKADGTEVKTARGINSQVMQKAGWDLAPYAGKKMFIKVVDESTDGWGHITADNFQFDAEVLAEVPAIKAPTKAPAVTGVLRVTHSEAKGIGVEKGVMRRDPSDIIKVGDLYYVWYSKGKIVPGYDATVWYATSTDGHRWTEKGMALAKGKPGSWEGASVFTPNILVAEGRYWLFYTGTSRKFGKGFNPDSKIGIAVSDSPDGPWERLATNPALKNSDNPADFDSHLVDDACLVVRDGKYWFYYKGRQQGKSPAQTQMGLAIADHPQGPYVRVEDNPVIPGNHEVLVWPQGKGVAAMIGTTGPAHIRNTVQYAEDGIHFSKTHDVKSGPWAGGAYRPEAFTQSGTGGSPKWGVEIGRAKGQLPFIHRFDVVETK